MVQQYLWKGGGANWLWSALIDNCWIFEAKANFFSFGGCWVKILVPHSAAFLIQKAKTGWRGIVEGIRRWRNVWMPEEEEGRDCLRLFVDNGGIWISNANQQSHFWTFVSNPWKLYFWLFATNYCQRHKRGVKYFHKSDCRRNAAADLLPSYHQRFP